MPKIKTDVLGSLAVGSPVTVLLYGGAALSPRCLVVRDFAMVKDSPAFTFCFDDRGLVSYDYIDNEGLSWISGHHAAASEEIQALVASYMIAQKRVP